MSSILEIPTTNQPQSQIISLGGTQYTLITRWNDPNQSWVLDVEDSTGNPILNGIPLTTGADLLEQFGYLGIGGGGSLVVQSDNAPDLVPDASTLGTTGHLFWVTPT